MPDAKECYWYLCNIHSGKYQYDKWPEGIEDFVSLGFCFVLFCLWNLSYRGAAIPLPVVRDHLNGNLPTTVGGLGIQVIQISRCAISNETE